MNSTAALEHWSGFPLLKLPKLPRVVPDQKSKFESDDLFRQLSTDSAICYTGYIEESHQQRQHQFYKDCCQGRTEITFSVSGINVQLLWNTNPEPWTSIQENCCDFNKEQGKVHIISHFIMNGVCVIFRGWLDIQSFDGVGCVEYDEQRALNESAVLQNDEERLREFLRVAKLQRPPRC